MSKPAARFCQQCLRVVGQFMHGIVVVPTKYLQGYVVDFSSLVQSKT